MDWLRLWHDMPNDPKWRTIARLSSQPIALVQAMYLHLLVDASRNVTRGHVTVTKEDIASALDVTEEQIESIFSAMQGRVLDGDCVTGWAKRQPKREDAGSAETGAKSAAQRKREQRERQKAEQEKQGCHDESRTVTTSHDRLDTDTDKETPPPAREDVFDSRTRFAMTSDWQPDTKTFPAALMQLGIPGIQVSQDDFLEFRSFWIATPDDHRTQAKWEHALASHLKRNLRNQQAGGVRHAPANQAGGRPGRQAPMSAVDRVKAAIAEREAREAAAEGHGQALGEDDGDLRPPLDVEFRRIS
ncbi:MULTISPECIES: DnaT-like ssDNA-binding domain-containing protein [Pseudomonas]|uniref:DnaT-like ssDNA-binding domain-containing protein n=1 Tax=Pseudomonas TaxID=286 RepID=UPI00257963DF|nr:MULTISPECIES: DnaT-like ssDNA-binding domain-containing protein [Pseudomonas]